MGEIKGWFSNLKYWFYGKSELSSLILTNYKYIFVSKLFKVCTSVYKISITKYIHTNERQAVRPFWPGTKAFILRLMCAWGHTLCVKIRIKDNNHYFSGEIVNCHAINSNISLSKKDNSGTMHIHQRKQLFSTFILNDLPANLIQLCYFDIDFWQSVPDDCFVMLHNFISYNLTI